jgi:hypothetical protein
MHMSFRQHLPRSLAGAALRVVLGFLLAGASLCAMAQSGGAAGMRASHTALADQLRNNQFGRPLVMDSTESPNDLKGDIYAVVDHPFATVNASLNDAGEWCDVMILHLNTKYCRSSGKGSGAILSVAVGKKFDQPLDQAYRVEFAWKPVASTADYLEIQLEAPNGPMGTNDYRILLQAIPLNSGRSFIHLRYSYGYGFAGRMAMKAYLATAGSDKVGFTVVGKSADGEPEYIGGVRGLVERNTMRYYLAIDAYLSAVPAPAAAQLDKRLNHWFAATERYPRQLHELDQAQYIDMKRAEYKRQQTAQ